jgi:CRP/FNR family cyclic AMP-dependent transcriptional regulator
MHWMGPSRLHLLKNMPVFGGLNDAAIGLILERSTFVEVRNGGYFFRQGDQSNSTFVLESGQVAVLKSWRGSQYTLRRMGVGDCFGEMALIDFGPRSATILAEADSTAIEFSPSCLFEIAKQDLEQYALVYMNMARELSRRLRLADDRLFEVEAEVHSVATGESGTEEEFVFNST